MNRQAIHSIPHPYHEAFFNHDGFTGENLPQSRRTLPDVSKMGLWSLTRYALTTITSLQKQVSVTQDLLQEKDDEIALLRQLATTDPLTGLLNRRGFLNELEKELCKTHRDTSRGGLLIMIDLDNFKAINDRYGHNVGDEALRLVSQTLTAHIRKMDTAARLGGDEFVLIFANAHPIETSARLQKLARKLNSLSLKTDEDFIPIRASLGIQSYDKGDNMDAVLRKADGNMYENKRRKDVEETV